MSASLALATLSSWSPSEPENSDPENSNPDGTVALNHPTPTGRPAMGRLPALHAFAVIATRASTFCDNNLGTLRAADARVKYQDAWYHAFVELARTDLVIRPDR